jgi:formylglycine-generating enzyme required for sulfatase activity
MKMVYVEGGTFQMGATSEQGNDAYDYEKPVHTVTLDSYYIAECEVTQEQWQKIMGGHFTGAYYYPVRNVSWEKATLFCKKLSELTGKRYVLPTEAQWEYAARGGKKSKGYKYSGSNTIDNIAWYWDNSRNTPHGVKQKHPNELGLYDMSGNVYEWCSDWYRYGYPSNSQTNPTGPSSGSERVLRGGGYGGDARDCRVSARFYGIQSYGLADYGFRICMLP